LSVAHNPAEQDIDNRIVEYVVAFKSSGAIVSPAVESAFRKVPRHKLLDRFYVPRNEFSLQTQYDELVVDHHHPSPDHLELIYSHRALATRLGSNGHPTSSTSMPALVAQMLELLRLRPGHKVLEIGAGTGYNAALMAEVVEDHSQVVTLDIQTDVVEQCRRLLAEAGYGDIQVLERDGFFGASEEAPFDRIVATVGLFDISPHWADQLTNEGEMLLPLYQGGSCPLIRVHKENGRLVGKVVGASGFMPIQGKMSQDSSDLYRTWVDEVEEVERRPGWDLGKGMVAPRYDFWFFLSASDSRGMLLPISVPDEGSTWTDWTFGLRDGRSRVIVGVDEIVLVGRAELLLDRLEELRDRWEGAGRPAAGDFVIEFVPKGDHIPEPDGMVVEREYHTELLRLPKT
jgi:protein-L-isoaspartate(D-aspartate) O-methyltransferase